LPKPKFNDNNWVCVISIIKLYIAIYSYQKL
jgi:hypothetical protein